MPSPRRYPGPIGRFLARCAPYWRRSVVPPPPAVMLEQVRGTAAPGPIDLIAVFPTHIGRPVDAARTTLAHFVTELGRASREQGVRIGVYVGLQFGAGSEHAPSVAMAEALATVPLGEVDWIAVQVMQGRLKVYTLNAGIDFGRNYGARAITWIDDDVSVDPGGLSALIGAWRSSTNPRDTVWGLSRHGESGKSWFSRMVAVRRRFHRKQRTVLGCSVLLKLDTPILPFPPSSDDTWLASKLIEPDSALPFERHVIVESHAVHYMVPNALAYSLSRARRIHTNQILDLAELTPAQMEVFFTGSLFGGVFASRAGGGPRAWLGMLIALPMQLGNFTLWNWQATYLLIRGALNRPVPHPAWAIGDRYVSPLITHGPPPEQS